MEFTTNDHVHLNYTDTGETDRQPVVFIPGIGGSSKMFMDAGELFHQHFRVITLDPRNQGLSEHTYKGQRISRHAIDVRELFTKLDLKMSSRSVIQWVHQHFGLIFLYMEKVA